MCGQVASQTNAVTWGLTRHIVLCPSNSNFAIASTTMPNWFVIAFWQLPKRIALGQTAAGFFHRVSHHHFSAQYTMIILWYYKHPVDKTILPALYISGGFSSSRSDFTLKLLSDLCISMHNRKVMTEQSSRYLHIHQMLVGASGTW
jgi:hypothetical protein